MSDKTTLLHTPELDFQRQPSRTDTYMHLLIDDAFKTVFGRMENKSLMIGLITAIIPELNIVDLEFAPNQAPHVGEDTKKSVYDVRCKLYDGTHIIVEVQRDSQNNFKERVLYYGSMPVSSQVKDGEGYNLDPVFVISFLDFKMDHGPEWRPRVKSHYILKEREDNEEMTDKLQFVFIELPRFNKTLVECETFEEKLYYCMRHLFRYRSQPEELSGKYFDKLFHEAALANLTAEQKTDYYRAMTTERDIRNQIRYAQEQGFEAGKAEGKAEGVEIGIEKNKLNNAKQLKTAGVALETIAACIGLDIETVKAL